MRTENRFLLAMGLSRLEVRRIIGDLQQRAPDLADAIHQLVDGALEADDAPRSRAGRFAVEVCWEHQGEILCRTYQVRAHSEAEAERRGLAKARRGAAAGVDSLQVTDACPLPRPFHLREV